MNPFSAAWNWLTAFLTDALVAIHDVIEPLFGVEQAWGWAIIALTLIVRVLMLPLAIKQTRSMKGMQAIQPKVKEIQGKYKVDRELMRKDPERYQKLKAKQNEELMALYKDEGVNPAASCLPLLLQMPIFFALFRILGVGGLDDLRDASFYFFTDFIAPSSDAIGLGATISAAGWPGWLLIVLMAASMFITQRQMMARNAVEGPAATQQKIMMYVFPVFLAVISLNFPLAVVLYWVTTNIWQGVQQYIMFRVTTDAEGNHIPSRKQRRTTESNGGTKRRLFGIEFRGSNGDTPRADGGNGNGRPDASSSRDGGSSSRGGASSSKPAQPKKPAPPKKPGQPRKPSQPPKSSQPPKQAGSSSHLPGKRKNR